MRAAHLAMNLSGLVRHRAFMRRLVPNGTHSGIAYRVGVVPARLGRDKTRHNRACHAPFARHMRPVGHLARVVAHTPMVGGYLAGLRIRVMGDAGAAVVALLVRPRCRCTSREA